MEEAPVKFRVIRNPQTEAWRAFVESHPSGSIFQHPGLYLLYNSVQNISCGVLAVIDEADKIAGVLVYAIFFEEGFKKSFTRRSIIHGGPLAVGDDAKIIQQLLIAYSFDIKRKGIIYTEFRNLYDTSGFRPVFEKYRFKYVDHLNVHIDLGQSEEDLITGMHKKRWSNIKRALKKGVYSRELNGDNEINDGYELIKKTYKRIHLPIPPMDLFLNAKECLQENVKMFGAFSAEKMIGVRVYLFYRDTIYDWYAGSDDEFFNLHPNDVLPWEMMRRAKLDNYKTYDFGGAGRPGTPYGVRVYKQRFGGATVNTGRYIRIHKPFLFYLGKWVIKYYKYFKHL